MSSGIGFNELIVLFVIGLLILGPERLPRVATQIGRWVGRARRTANQLRYQLEREIALADIEKRSGDKKDEQPPSQRPTSDSADTDAGEQAEPAAGDADGAAREPERADEEPNKPTADG